jgi:hypothetical protein
VRKPGKYAAVKAIVGSREGTVILCKDARKDAIGGGTTGYEI